MFKDLKTMEKNAKHLGDELSMMFDLLFVCVHYKTMLDWLVVCLVPLTLE